jgi:hypothetical protein
MPLLKLQMSSYFTVLRTKDRNYLLPVCFVYATESVTATVSMTALLLCKRVCKGIL